MCAQVAGHLSAYGWAMFADPVLQAVRLFVSEDNAPILDTGQPHPLDPAAVTVEAAPSVPATDPADPMLRTISAAFDVAQLRPLDVRRLGAVEAGGASNVAAFSELTGSLRFGDSVSRFELVVGLRNFSTNGPPTVFSS